MTSQEIERIFSIAIKREMEANAFYSRIAKKAINAEVRELFSQLAEDEMGHFELLQGFKSDPTLPMKIPAPAKDYKIAEETELPPFTDDMKPKDAVALAMKKEQQAVEFYKKLAGHSHDTAMKDIFENLANMELGHKQKLENLFVEIGYPEVF